jgi:putative IMPACT (imprinted ancient) family translation regulator
VRFRHEIPASRFAVFVGPLATPEEAVAVVRRLGQADFPEAVAHGVAPGLMVRVGEPGVLREAVRLATRLKEAGYEVRVSEQSGRPSGTTLRHGSFGSREEALAVSRAVAALGVPNEVVRVR